MDYTHIIIKHSADDKEYLYRASDGMRIGGRQHSVVVYGNNPNKSESHVFVDSHHAHVYLCNQCCVLDLKVNPQESDKVIIDYRSGDPVGIIIPEGMGEEFMGSSQKIRKIV
jgi:hypothetical protein